MKRAHENLKYKLIKVKRVDEHCTQVFVKWICATTTLFLIILATFNFPCKKPSHFTLLEVEGT